MHDLRFGDKRQTYMVSVVIISCIAGMGACDSNNKSTAESGYESAHSAHNYNYSVFVFALPNYLHMEYIRYGRTYLFCVHNRLVVYVCDIFTA